MRRTILIVTAALTLVSGCYLGRTQTKKREAKTLNGVAIVFGGVLMSASVASAFGGGTACNGDCNGGIGLSRGDPSTGSMLLIGATLIQAAIAADIVIACVPTEPESVPAPTTAQRATVQGVVTAPGLAPTRVGLR